MLLSLTVVSAPPYGSVLCLVITKWWYRLGEGAQAALPTFNGWATRLLNNRAQGPLDVPVSVLVSRLNVRPEHVVRSFGVVPSPVAERHP